MCAFRQGSLAQLVEQLAFNQLVDGSNPSRPTNSKGCFGSLFFMNWIRCFK